ncbi:hypothetical protein, variant [Saprolegnia diclina VS20]|uniref:Ubiquitin-like domain-containing protein n=1 Tax=Saprolegnia diclina (strain VS20) TaxID=1156394 RepID=T0S258_SAPDV|nr:hypothetical protein, variant [Saprolegnia diclina VS20]EQC36912.1 hypothetical protein, variant [Saprolegnia diclina VS20]|eukprot:XP_008609692.1 hypothetical protein, variant [Saprolegnia diclina VS20]
MEAAAAIDDVLAMAMTRQESCIEIRIKTLNDHSFALQVRPAIAVSELKEMLRTTTQVPEHRQRLIYRGKLMKDADQLAAYNVEDGHTLHLVAKPEQIYSADGTSASETEPLLPPARSVLRPQLRPRQSRLDSAAAFASMRRRLGLDEDGSLLSDALNFRQPRPTAPVPSDAERALDLTSEPESEARPPAVVHDPFEHIEQGLLTLRTLLSTVTSATPTETTSAERGATLRARRLFYVGQWLDVKDTVNQWLEGTVLELSATHVRVHYHGWPTRWDEWIEKISPRLAAFRTRTLHPTGSPFLSPTPIVRSARSTPPPTARSLVPQIRDALRDMLPYVDQLATLCDEPDATPALTEAADVVGSLFDRVGRVLVDAATHIESLTTPHHVSNDAYGSPRSASRRGPTSYDSTFRELIVGMGALHGRDILCMACVGCEHPACRATSATPQL